MQTTVQKLFISEKKKNVLLWTALSGGVVSLSSVVTLLIVSRCLGLTDAGIYSIALAVSQQLSSIGTYCLRTFHSSDIRQKYTIDDYRILRYFTCFAMFGVSILWIWLHGYDTYKGSVVLAMCLYKVVESYSDLYEGTYQRNDRFDISGKSSFVKETAAMICSLIVILAGGGLLLAMLSMSIIYLLLFWLIDLKLIDVFEHIGQNKAAWVTIRELLVLGFPIVVNSYLMLYINNVSKYTIDRYCTQGDVAIFNVLYMPVFCINLLMGFITRPMITVLAKKADEKKKKDIRNILLKQIVTVIGITLIVIAGMYLIGLKLLEILYSMELQPYKKELLLLLLGGAFYAGYTIFYYMITILRKQFALLVSCCIGAIIAFAVMPKLVSRFGMLGAAGGYAVIMFFIMLICMLFVFIYMHKMKG